MQPKYCFGETEERLLIDQLQIKMKETIGTAWIERLNDIKPLIQIKWSLIMVNQIYQNKLQSEQQIRQLKNAIIYYRESIYIK